MLAQVVPVRGEEQDRTIERPAVAFDDSDDEVDGMVTSNLGELGDRRTRDVDGAFLVAAEPLSPFG